MAKARAEMLKDWAEGELGSPYVFGAAGQKCTPDYRRGVAASKPLYADAITRNCPVLSGRQSTCAGCKYNGRKAYDCRGLTREGVRYATGRPVMGAGATSQWNDASNWEEKGLLKDMPDKVCLVFKADGNTMAHTGIYVRNNQFIHASGHNTGVIKSTLPRGCTHYAVPKGLYEGGLPMPEQTDPFLIRIRDKGALVTALQQGLIKLGYKMPKFGADGSFGAETEAAVKQFQKDFKQPEDGAWDSACQAMLEDALDDLTPVEEPVTPADIVHAQYDRVVAELEALRKLL